jgi:hypothetical protein
LTNKFAKRAIKNDLQELVADYNELLSSHTRIEQALDEAQDGYLACCTTLIRVGITTFGSAHDGIKYLAEQRDALSARLAESEKYKSRYNLIMLRHAELTNGDHTCYNFANMVGEILADGFHEDSTPANLEKRNDAGQQSALQRYAKFTKDDDSLSPLEQLRFFCSLAMSGQDWLDVERFFDALEGEQSAEAAQGMVMLDRAYNLLDAASKIMMMAAPEEVASEESNNPLSQYCARFAAFKNDYKAMLSARPK